MFSRSRATIAHLRHVRRYANGNNNKGEDPLNLHTLANSIEQGPPARQPRQARLQAQTRVQPQGQPQRAATRALPPHQAAKNSPVQSTSTRSLPPGYEHSQSFKQGKKLAPKPPEGFVPFDVLRPYSPYDFLPANRAAATYRPFRPQEGPPKPLAIREDLFHQLSLNPLNETLNCGLISSYTTRMGRIQRRGETKLTWKTQRLMGKAIRRARAMGLIPAFSQWREDMIKSGR